MKTNRYFFIRCKTKSERNVALAALLSLGAKWHGKDLLKTPKEVEDRWPYETYNNLNIRKIDDNIWEISGNGLIRDNAKSLSEVYTAVEEDLNKKILSLSN